MLMVTSVIYGARVASSPSQDDVGRSLAGANLRSELCRGDRRRWEEFGQVTRAGKIPPVVMEVRLLAVRLPIADVIARGTASRMSALGQNRHKACLRRMNGSPYNRKYCLGGATSRTSSSGNADAPAPSAKIIN